MIVCVCVFHASLNLALPSPPSVTWDARLLRLCVSVEEEGAATSSYLHTSLAPSSRFIGARWVPETPVCSVIRGYGASAGVPLAGLHAPGRKRPVACCSVYLCRLLFIYL